MKIAKELEGSALMPKRDEPKQKPLPVPTELLSWDMDCKDKYWSDDGYSLTLTPENITRIWNKQNEIIAFLRERFPDA